MTRPGGMTLIEVLVALAVFTIFAAAAVAALATGLRASAEAGRLHRATALLEPYAVPARTGAAPPAACTAGPAQDAPCTARREKCRLSADGLVCDGSGGLRLTVVRLAPPGDGRPHELRSWSRVSP